MYHVLRRAAPLPIILCLLTPLQACLNDRDTLAEEARGLPDVIQVITGRFPRNPPLFYEMRVQRVATELQQNPTRLDLYDDAGVACDRIGRDAEALVWMQRKLPHLRRANAGDPAVREHWYRFYANRGTFRAHRWLRAGADRKRIREMQAARDDIRQAIAIKPNAHFGREKYQFKAMQWIIAPPRPAYDGELPDFLGIIDKVSDMGDKDQLAHLGYGDLIKGLSGLITLGNAWESVDIFYELKVALGVQGKMTLLYLTDSRIEELIRSGHHSLYASAPTGASLIAIAAPQRDLRFMSYPTTDRPEQVRRFYAIARTEADDYQRRRSAYMMARLKAGRHPDSDSTFWNDWHDAGPPSPEIIHSWWFNHPWATPLLRSLAAIAALSLLLLRVVPRRPLAAPSAPKPV